MSSTKNKQLAAARKKTARCQVCGGFTKKGEATCLRCDLATAKTAAEAIVIWKRLRPKIDKKIARELRSNKRKTWPTAA